MTTAPSPKKNHKRIIKRKYQEMKKTVRLPLGEGEPILSWCMYVVALAWSRRW